MMNKIKITFFLQYLTPGGAQKSIIRLIDGIDKNRFQISLVLSKTYGCFIKEIPAEINVINLDTEHYRWSIIKIIRYIRKEHPDILFSALTHINIAVSIAKFFSFTKTRLIISERTTFSLFSDKSTNKLSHKITSCFIFPVFMKVFYPLANVIICVSHGVADDLYKIIGVLPNIKVIYNPVVSDTLYSLASQPTGDAKFDNIKTPIIIAVGRLTKAKDYPTLLKSLKLLLNKLPVHLVIIGEGEERKRLEYLIDELKINNNVILLGLQENPYKYVSKADLFVLSSQVEGFPNVLVEAMACGTPVISTDCQSGPNEIIEDGKNGFLVPVGDEKSLAEKIVKLLEDPELRKRFSEEGKKQAKFFSVARSVKEYENIFEKLLL